MLPDLSFHLSWVIQAQYFPQTVFMLLFACYLKWLYSTAVCVVVNEELKQALWDPSQRKAQNPGILLMKKSACRSLCGKSFVAETLPVCLCRQLSHLPCVYLDLTWEVFISFPVLSLICIRSELNKEKITAEKITGKWLLSGFPLNWKHIYDNVIDN